MGQEVSSKLVRYIHYCSTGTFNPQMDDDDDDDEYHHVNSDPRLSLTSTSITAVTTTSHPSTGQQGEPPIGTTDKSVLSTSQIDVANDNEMDENAGPLPTPVAPLNRSSNDDHRAIAST